jgi:hypothetical protein
LRTKLSLTGTARYASINAHKGFEQSRRDDLEASGYMMMYFLRGVMPWSGLAAKTKQEKFTRIAECKINTDLNVLCEGHPPCFQQYIVATRNLEYMERPDYEALRQGFRDAFTATGYVEDYDFDWYKGRPPKFEAIGPFTCPAQPDDESLSMVSAPSLTTPILGDACEKANERVTKKSEELARIQQAFNAWDINHDGGIDKEEFTKVLLAIGISEADVVSMFERADLNHDGVINYAEFLQWIQGDIPQNVREEVYALHGDHTDDPEKEKEAA